MEARVSVLLLLALILSSLGLGLAQSDSSLEHNIVDYGAVGDGQKDDTNAFNEAWEATCSSSPSSAFFAPIMKIPSNMTFLINQVRFRGPCNSPIINVEIDGEIIAPEEPSDWKCSGNYCDKWIQFKEVNGLRISGGGTIHGRGDKWWSMKSRKKPTAIEISDSDNVQITDLNFKNNPRMHLVLNHLSRVYVKQVTIIAPGNSPNTDGIHVTGSTDVMIQNCRISTGDDCISIVDGSASVMVSEISCGPGHGVSIGSLGKHGADDKVENIHVTDVVFSGSQNGARIKSWQGGSGYARNITFERILTHDAANPIIIDQFYCDHEDCTVHNSAVQIEDITFRQIIGTSKKTVAVKLDCSDTFPCKNIVLEDIYILSREEKNTTSDCKNVQGVIQGRQIPYIDCLKQT